MSITLFLILGLIPCVLADDWEDFTNNLATDLAPLITLFGERLTMQFLSESISLLDNIIFALSPLGVLTAVVSVIRICGSSSLRAFIGRAQEGPAEAEGELLPCVSESTAELFNDGGISRVFGRPRIVEVVAWEKEDQTTGEKRVKIGTLRDAVKEGAWSVKDNALDVNDIGDHTFMPELDIPNLSLNKGIKQKDRFWFYAAAIVGAVLQVGVLIYASLTVFVFPGSFQVDDKPVDSYAFPLYMIGTTFLFMGMFYCAVIIRRASKEYYFEPNMPSKLYWLQPGDQMVGDQVFNAFLAVQEGKKSSMTKDLQYIKSKRVMKHDGRTVEVYFTLFLTLLGFIFQFVGERGLHASVILAQLGSTFIMTVLRTFLRTERMTTEENALMSERELVSHKEQELDSFAFHLEGAKSFNLLHFSRQSVNPPVQSLAPRLIQTRTKLARITCDSGNDDWNDIPIRRAAHSLAKTIESTMNLVSSWGVKFGKEFSFALAFEAVSNSPKNIDTQFGGCAIRIPRRGDSLAWAVDANELEAIIGLCTWSLYKSEEQWRGPLYRLVGLDEHEASQAETFLYFHKWIFRETEATLVSRKTVDASKRLFGFRQKKHPSDREALVVKTDNELEIMVAQDILIRFLEAIFSKMVDLGGEVDVVSGLQNDWRAQSTRIDSLVQLFEDSHLGSREDALLCIVPTLRRSGILPDLAGDSARIRERTEAMIKRGDWENAFRLHQWICQRSDGAEFERSVYSLAYLYRRASLSYNKFVREAGLQKSCSLLKVDIRRSFFESKGQPEFINWTASAHRVSWWYAFARQFGWMLWHISAKMNELQRIETTLTSLNLDGKFPDASNTSMYQTDDALGIQMLLVLLPLTKPGSSELEAADESEMPLEMAFELALSTNNDGFVYWVMLRYLELSKEKNESRLTFIAWVLAIKSRKDWIIQLLVRYEAGINTHYDPETVLDHFIRASDLKAVETALVNGASPNGCDKASSGRPVLDAASRGSNEILELLLRFGGNLDTVEYITGFSAVHKACQHQQPATTEWLVSHGADIEARGADGITPLFTAIDQGDITMVQTLLDLGADVNAANLHMESVLVYACKSKSTDASALRLLLNKGADPHIKNFYGSKALDIAREWNFAEGILILEEAMGISPSDAISHVCV